MCDIPLHFRAVWVFSFSFQYACECAKTKIVQSDDGFFSLLIRTVNIDSAVLQLIAQVYHKFS